MTTQAQPTANQLKRQNFMASIFGADIPDGALRTRAPEIMQGLDYTIYTTQYDEDVLARHLLEPDYKEQRSFWPAFVNEFVGVDPKSFKLDTPNMPEGTDVHIEMDFSGSMRGDQIKAQVQLAYATYRLLQLSGASVSMAAHTTRRWKGGLSRQDWLDNGRPENPGRLNDLLTVRFAGASQKAAPNIRDTLAAIGSREGILRENIDGEALARAHREIIARPGAAKTIILMGDGAAVDDSTLASNDGKYLQHHFDAVTGTILRFSPVQLVHAPIFDLLDRSNIPAFIPLLREAFQEQPGAVIDVANQLRLAVFEHAVAREVANDIALGNTAAPAANM